MNSQQNWIDRILNAFTRFEQALAVISASVIAVIIVISVVRIMEDLYTCLPWTSLTRKKFPAKIISLYLGRS
jgi:hypothetical protein